jgi:hypothetical protein
VEQGYLSARSLVTLRRLDCLASAGDACRFERGTLDGCDEIRTFAFGACELALQMRARLR